MSISIPIIYRVLANRIHKNSENGTISVKKAKLVITMIYRMPPKSATRILRELKDYGLLRFHNCRTVVIHNNSEFY